MPGTYPAEVPGCVHTDLMAAGVIPDPYLDGNEAALRWMHEIDWRYATMLDADALDLGPPSPGERVDLFFDGIDTVGDRTAGGSALRIGVELGRTYNMHRSYRFDISSHLTGRPSNSKLIFTRPPPTPRLSNNGSGICHAPIRRRTTSFARWPAALAGTGDPTYAPPGSGSRSGWSVGALPGWLG